ncbi:MAG: ABC transporter ATP-binding protein [Verrucomicrobia bacterium Tous-C9LFEB]|nr:MAG: ABC transporter ATP-binding protein [Verrucomicrobia bacterium Tous-C9LFEB]
MSSSLLEKATTQTAAIETVGLCKRFGQVTALDHVNLRIHRGEFTAFMGASGSGKTTLMNIMTCLDTATEGKVLLDGRDVATFDDEMRRKFRSEKIGLVFQQFHLIPYLSALENVMLAQHYHSVVDEPTALKVLEQFGMGHRVHHLPKQLSGGEQQRVCIARALVNEPPFIFADEPTGNLDEENEQVVMDFLKQLHSQGRTIIMVTHNPDLARSANRIVRLHHGKYLGEELENAPKV